MEHSPLTVQIQNSEKVTCLVTGLYYGEAIQCKLSYLKEPEPLKEADIVHVPREARRTDPCVYAVETMLICILDHTIRRIAKKHFRRIYRAVGKSQSTSEILCSVKLFF